MVVGRDVAEKILLLTEKADVIPAVLARAAAVKREERGAMVELVLLLPERE